MICMKFQTFKIQFRGGAKSFKFGWVFFNSYEGIILYQLYHHYEQQSIIVLL